MRPLHLLTAPVLALAVMAPPVCRRGRSPGLGPDVLMVFPGDAQEVPPASNLNLDAGQILPNLVLGRLGADGTLGIYNDTGEVHVLADLAGFFVDP